MSTDTWLRLPEHTPFGPGNLPHGVFADPADPAGAARVGIRIGDHVLDAAPTLARAGHPALARALNTPSLNALLALGRDAWTELRALVTEWLAEERHRPLVEPRLIPAAGLRMLLPFEPADYVDFYASEHHAANVGRIFRPGSPPLTPNWRHLPIGYHGRAGTVVVSGTEVVRPSGQLRPNPEAPPEFAPCRRLDIEAEVGFVVGTPSELGEPVPAGKFAEHVFGALLVNDWSARDIQSWEYVPLGPFLGKSFATSVAPWVVPLDALEAARVRPPARDPEPLPYLRDHGDGRTGYDLRLEVRLNGHRISEPPFREMYWTAAQQLAHLTVNGASLRTGDLYASGTVSGPEPHQLGSLLELTRGGKEPIKLPDGTERGYLEDGDEVVITATAPGPGGSRIGFGEVAGRILPARPAASNRSDQELPTG